MKVACLSAFAIFLVNAGSVEPFRDTIVDEIAGFHNEKSTIIHMKIDDFVDLLHLGSENVPEKLQPKLEVLDLTLTPKAGVAITLSESDHGLLHQLILRKKLAKLGKISRIVKLVLLPHRIVAQKLTHGLLTIGQLAAELHKKDIGATTHPTVEPPLQPSTEPIGSDGKLDEIDAPQNPDVLPEK